MQVLKCMHISQTIRRRKTGDQRIHGSIMTKATQAETKDAALLQDSIVILGDYRQAHRLIVLQAKHETKGKLCPHSYSTTGATSDGRLEWERESERERKREWKRERERERWGEGEGRNLNESIAFLPSLSWNGRMLSVLWRIAVSYVKWL